MLKDISYEIYSEFPSEKWISTFLRPFWLEFAQKIQIFRSRVLLEVVSKSFLILLLRELSQKKSVQVRNLVYIRVHRRSASCMTKQKETTGVCSWSRRGHPRHVRKYNCNNCVRMLVFRRIAPGRRSAVRSVSLSRHSASYVHG